MLVGSQLKNAQLEVVADIASLPATDLVIGRIVYVKDQAQLYLYDGAWKALYTKEDTDAAIDTDVNAKSDQITGGSGGAAPTRTVNDIEAKQDEIIAGTQAIVPVTNITNNTTSLLANKTPPQEMVVSFSFEGHSLGGSVNNSIINRGNSGPNDNLRTTIENFATTWDGVRVIPFDFEVTGWSANVTVGAGSGVTYGVTLNLDGAGLTSTPLRFKSTTDGGPYSPVFYESFLNSSGEVVEGTAGQTVGGDTVSNVPVWNSLQKDGDAGDEIKVGANIYDSTGTAISLTDSGWGSCYVNVFIRRRALE